MRLGDLLIAAKIVSHKQIDEAVAHQNDTGCRLGESLVATGALTNDTLEKFLNRIPIEPENIRATGINPSELLNLLIKLIYTTRIESVSQFAQATKLPPPVVEELVAMAIDRNLLANRGVSGLTLNYALSELGRHWAQDALKTSLYTGPAPVTLSDFCERVDLQKVTNDNVSFENIRDALQDYDVTDQFIEKIGPALNSGKAMLLYGPPGNGKTSVALSFANIFNSVIYIPYAVTIEGQIMRVFDPNLHKEVRAERNKQSSTFISLRRERFDARWVPIYRPFVLAGGELTLEMLDLSYDPATGFYEAPMQIKALGGCLVIDDFGRQMVNPTTLLNRWIVPMESRIDFLKLHTGKSFSVPFETLLIFSTNLNPEDLMDPAFLRRLSYKLEIGAPNLETYKGIFQKLCNKRNIKFTEDIFKVIVYKITKEKKMELAAFQPSFIVDQIIAVSRFRGTSPQFDLAGIDYAIDNLKVSTVENAPEKDI
jgi:DNA polymerase III delta prime subunit